MRARASLACAWLLAVTGCSGGGADPQTAVAEARAHAARGDTDAARRVLEKAIRAHPDDPSLRIAAARTEIVAGQPAAAEGLLRRARELGASEADTVAPLASALLAQKRLQAALDLIGDPARWSPGLAPTLALLRGRVLLSLPVRDPSAIRQQILAAHRLRDQAVPHLSAAELASLDREFAALREHEPLAVDALEHFTCTRDAAPAELSPVSDVARRRTLRVGPTRELRQPSDAARVARDGDVVEIDGGDYPNDVAVWRQNGLLLRGVDGRPHLRTRGRLAQDAGIWVLSGHDVVIENIELSGARSPDRNGSGIRFLGRNLTLRDCYIHDNEAGLLTAAAADGEVLVERCEFARNGFGDGLSHNIYVGRVRRFTLRFSYSHGAHVGHAVKSRAAANHILFNRIADGQQGDGSYLVDIAEGGEAFIVGNELHKGGASSNAPIVSYAAERPGSREGRLRVVHNSLSNGRLDAFFVKNYSAVPALIENNALVGARAIVHSGFDVERGNTRRPDHGMANVAAFDLRLTAASPLVDAGVAPADLPPEAAVAFEYVHPLAARKRQKIGPPDVGAHEFCGR